MHIFDQLAKSTELPVSILITVDHLDRALDFLLYLHYHNIYVSVLLTAIAVGRVLAFSPAPPALIPTSQQEETVR